MTFLSFLVFGSVPLWGYVIISASGSDINTDVMFVISCLLAGLTMFALGAFKVRAAAAGTRDAGSGGHTQGRGAAPAPFSRHASPARTGSSAAAACS